MGFNMMCLLLFLILFMQQEYSPQTGDLLFQDIDCGPLCDAIESVTIGVDGKSFSHVGVVIEKDSGIFVLEAISAGVVLTPLNQFLGRSRDVSGNPKVVAGRLKKNYLHLVDGAIPELEKYLGQTYDSLYLMDNDSYYCSELIYLAFRAANHDKEFFPLSPMTFKSPGTHTFFPAWREYYETMHAEIPEGMPGINPGAISRSEYLEIIYSYGKQ